jgi:glycosyltransferase involved in cell wall biosynthesis
MEAQSQGVACVATDVSAIHELIIDGQTGLLVPPQDPQALAQALESMIRNPQRRQALGQAGRLRVSAEFGLSSNIERLARKFGLPAASGTPSA